MNRRGFLASMLVAAAAPAIVRADSLMRLVPRDLSIIIPWDYSGGFIREIRGNDIRTDQTIIRFDVMCKDASGAMRQQGVDMRAYAEQDFESSRHVALEVLKASIRRDGLRPIRNALPLNTAYGSARFL